MSSPEIVAARWIRTQLLASATLAASMGLAPSDMVARILDDTAPQDTPDPYIRFNKQSGVDVVVLPAGNHVWCRMSYTVRWVKTTTNLADLDAGAIAIFRALNRTMGAVDGGRVDGCYRTEPFSKQSQRGDLVDSELGGMYRLEVIGYM